jgi:peptide deformylase
MARRTQQLSEADERALDRARRDAAFAQIRQYPDPCLKERAREVGEFDDDLASLATRMLRLMDDAHGAGLAAPQIGLLRRVLVYQLEDEDPVVLVNPTVTDASEEASVVDEGCLSLDLLIRRDVNLPVERPTSISVHAFDVSGEEIEFDADGHEARVIQHEIDHLDGTLILDRTDVEHRRLALRTLRGAV